ncbi:protein unc-13 homolog C-like [Dendronephthya gigantea]|uniref:protein unc-13 homolog C-like n=1 Tax=Dendronephthya gigantea TaxID=151771 RepID=UPI00106AF788|nr:protein unc-13 homolog C-like [Dendronephthya gigantea]
MADKQQATKCAAQNLNNSNLCTPAKPVKSKIPKYNTPEKRLEDNEGKKEVDMGQIQQMFESMMMKLEKLDSIEFDVKEIKKSLEFAHAEIDDLKKENEKMKDNQDKARERIEKLEHDNVTMRNKIVDLQARSMRDNLLFFNIPERDQENTTDIIHELIETKMGMTDAKEKVKIDRSHRIGRKRQGNRKPRPIVVKFNFHQDREHVRLNAKKLRGTNIGVSEQFPEEIEKIRKTLYPELKKAKAEGKKAKKRDKLIIEGQVFYNNS